MLLLFNIIEINFLELTLIINIKRFKGLKFLGIYFNSLKNLP